MIAIGLGSNAENSLDYLRAAVRELKFFPSFNLKLLSPIYSSKAMLPEEAPADWNHPFLNAVALLETRESDPQEILSQLKVIEKKLGRVQALRWAPRKIDLDLLCVGEQEVTLPQLQIPHAGLFERPFAILPLLDIWPEWAPHLTSPHRSKITRWRSATVTDVPFETSQTSRSFTRLVGIINLTPDSFSDGGVAVEGLDFLKRARELAEAGADILDLGGESTRPQATTLSPFEEVERFKKVTSELAILSDEYPHLEFSLDTRNASAARAVFAFFPFHWLNDVTGFSDPKMVEVAAGFQAKLVCMHSLGVPPEANVTLPVDQSPQDHILEWGFRKIETLRRDGIAAENIYLDPGLGFGKTVAQNYSLMKEASSFHLWKTPLWYGHSRKSFMRELANDVLARDLPSAIMSATLASQGIEYVRVHDVRSSRIAIETRSRLSRRVYFDRHL